MERDGFSRAISRRRHAQARLKPSRSIDNGEIEIALGEADGGRRSARVEEGEQRERLLS